MYKPLHLRLHTNKGIVYILEETLQQCPQSCQLNSHCFNSSKVVKTLPHTIHPGISFFFSRDTDLVVGLVLKSLIAFPLRGSEIITCYFGAALQRNERDPSAAARLGRAGLSSPGWGIT